MIRANHKRLASLMEMIERCDSLISRYKSDMMKYEDIFWRNGHAKEVNRFVLIRRRLFKWYAEVFTRMAKAINEKNNAIPLTREQTLSPVREMRNMEIAEEHANKN